MAVRIRNMSQLQKALRPVMTKMVDQLAERAYETTTSDGHRTATGGQRRSSGQR